MICYKVTQNEHGERLSAGGKALFFCRGQAGVGFSRDFAYLILFIFPECLCLAPSPI